MIDLRTDVALRPIADLKPYDRNARTHSEAQIEQIAASIRKWGWTVPVLIDGEGGIIAGHGRVEAAKLIGLEAVPTMSAEGWSDAEKRAYVLADNKLAENADWDQALLASEIADLGVMEFDTSLIGFSDAEIKALMIRSNAGHTEPDDVPAEQEFWTSRPGDTWLLGDHRIRCGDSTSADDVTALLAGAKPNLMVTDPPYGVDYDPGWRNKAGAATTKRTGKVLNDDRADWREAWAMFPGDVAYVWHGDLHAAVVAQSLEAVGFKVRSQIIWAKDRFVLSRGDYHHQHEPCWYAVRKTGRGHWAGDRKQTTLWQIAHRDQDAETVHGTQKPVECMRRPILNNSQAGDEIYEPFSGSGTTIIAGEMEGRKVLAMEFSPGYVDLAVRRWQDFTAGEAIRESDGAKFNDCDTYARPQTEAA